MKKILLGRFTEKTPTTLLRIQTGMKVKLRPFKQGSYDFVPREDGLIHPAPLDDFFMGPNGMSLRPPGTNFTDILEHYSKSSKIFVIPENTVLEEYFVLLHEHGDHYSLQTSVACTPKVLNERMTEFLSKMEIISKNDYFERFADQIATK
jgi:hypothetical protein